MKTLRLTRAQAREVDRIAIEEYGIPGLVLMENAALAVVGHAARLRAALDLADKVLVLCGKGNNGGDGFAVARHLAIRGVPVTIALLTDPNGIKGDARVNFDIVRRMNLPIVEEKSLPLALDVAAGGLVIDAIYGTGFRPPARLDLKSIARMIRRSECATLAIDLPSGMECDTGRVIDDEVLPAHTTVTLVAEKAGFATAEGRRLAGEVVVGDIGIPRQIIRQAASTSADPR